jgi:hypothetical protein
MTSPIASMDAALYAALNVPDLTVGTGKATGGVHRYRLPLSFSPPAIVFGYTGDGDDEYSLGGRALVRLTYDVKVVFPGLSASTAATLADTIDSMLTNVALTVSGYTFMLGRRVRPIAYQEDADGGVSYQHVGGQYEFMLDPN